MNDHFDHCDMSKIQSRNEDCRLITQKEALEGGVHQSFDLGYVSVEAVEANLALHRPKSEVFKKNCRYNYYHGFINDLRSSEIRL